ncbi:MAG: hypothetical protein Q8O98_00175 [bacterium]|nr:hypothetical protein [bacterium]
MKNITPPTKSLIALILSLLLFAALARPANGQSVDSLWGFKQVRSFTDEHKSTLLIGLTAGTVAAQGFLHGSFYAGERGDIHGASELLGAAHYAFAYVAGLDAVQAMGATQIGMFFFQGFVNLGSGLPFIDPNEGRAYTAFGGDWSFKRIMVGYWRWGDLLIGTVLIAYKPIIRGVRRLF